MNKKYDQIGKTYDTTRRADSYLLSRLVHHVGVEDGNSYLDIACGSGNYTTKLAGRGGKWTGIDQSVVMLEKARAKSSEVQWFEGDVGDFLFDPDSFDGVTCTLAIHHFPSLTDVFSGVRKVLGDGKFVIFTSTAELMAGYWLNEYFPVAMERSREQMPMIDAIEKALTTSGFNVLEVEPYSIHEGLEDFFLYSGKHRPEMYLDESVRRGISTFSSLADEKEITHGCERLAADIESGRIDEVIRSYKNADGDYCFVVCE